MEPITILALGAAAVAFFALRKKKDSKPKVYTLTYDDLKAGVPAVALRAGDALEVVIPGLAEQMNIRVVGGGGLVLDAMLDIGQVAERGAVTYSFVAMAQPKPWQAKVQFFIMGNPAGTVELDYVV